MRALPRIGIFGGTFNPIHYGHLRAAEEACEAAGLDRIFFIPAGAPPLKSCDVAEARHRLAMTRQATRGNRCFRVLDIECMKAGTSYTVETLARLRQQHPKAELFFMLGIDAFLDIPNWRDPEAILSLTNFIIFSRPGWKFADLLSSPYMKSVRRSLTELDRGDADSERVVIPGGTELRLLNLTQLGISSSAIRERLREGRSIKYLLPPQVESYIISGKLYAASRKTAP